MATWESYPSDYRQAEAAVICAAVRAGECAAIAGLSGAGKTNLAGFLAHRVAEPRFVLVDCNRLAEPTPSALFSLVRTRLEPGALSQSGDAFAALETAIEASLAATPGSLGILLDRFDRLSLAGQPAIAGNLRALRDDFKYRLGLVVITRHPLPPDNELAELFFAHTLWLGPLSPENALWSARSFTQRHGLEWNAATYETIRTLTGGYPAFLRAACEAHAAGIPLEVAALLDAPAIRARLDEFWADQPTPEEIRASRLESNPLLAASRPAPITEAQLTAHEKRLLDALRAHPNQVCEKDDLIGAIWPEDKIFSEGVRDDSLAQLVRRLREKIEPDPANPHRIRTVPGRGYFFAV